MQIIIEEWFCPRRADSINKQMLYQHPQEAKRKIPRLHTKFVRVMILDIKLHSRTIKHEMQSQFARKLIHIEAEKDRADMSKGHVGNWDASYSSLKPVRTEES